MNMNASAFDAALCELIDSAECVLEEGDILIFSKPDNTIAQADCGARRLLNQFPDGTAHWISGDVEDLIAWRDNDVAMAVGPRKEVALCRSN